MLAADSSISTSTVACPSAAAVRAALAATDCSPVLFEFLEMADMCACTGLSVVIDLRQHRSVSLLQPTLAQFQGPALCLFLPDTILSRHELSELMRAHSAGLRGTPCRYGAGLMRGYEIGEMIFIVTGDRFLLFDPSGAFLLDDIDLAGDGDREDHATGKEYNYVASGLPRRFPDQFAPFGHYGFSGEQALPGTVIRIPLRTPTQSARSLIDNRVFVRQNNVMADEFIAEISKFYTASKDTSLLLFAQYLSWLRFTCIGAAPLTNAVPAQAPQPESEPESAPAPGDGDGDIGAALEKLTIDIDTVPDFFELKLESEPPADRWALLQEDWRPSFGSRFSKLFAGWKPPQQRLHLQFRFKTEHDAHIDRWLVCSTLAAGESRELAVDPQCRHLGPLIPMGSVALHLDRDGQHLAVEGKDFCCFPVGRKTGLPVHINGLFVLPNEHKLYYTNPTDNANQHVQAKWNTHPIYIHTEGSS
jgi:hypothetical protein